MSKLQLIFVLILSQIALSQADDTDSTFSKILHKTKQLAVGAFKEGSEFLYDRLKGIGENLIDYVHEPIEFIVKILHFFCIEALSTDNVDPKERVSIDKIGLQLHTPCKPYPFGMNKMVDLYNNKNFDKNKKTVVLITGWRQNVNNTEMISELTKAYFCRGDHNIIVVDAARYTNTLYWWAAYNTVKIGEFLGTALKDLYNKYPEDTRLHIVGFSLGAHIASAAAKNFYNLTRKRVDRITGLDPASVCFTEGETLEGLFRGDAKFVDVIHTDPTVAGKGQPLGHSDFYPNGMESSVQPGCVKIDPGRSHNRAWRYYTETVYPGNENNFLSTKCDSIERFRDNKCLGNPTSMGYNASIGEKGKYFLDVNSKSPFGLDGNEKREEKNYNCGFCTY